MKYQRGVSLNGLMFGAVILGVISLGAMKVAPELIEFSQINKAITATANDPGLKDASVAKIREAYSKFAEIDNIKKVAPSSHTVCEIVNARWGKTAHITFLFFCFS